MTDAWRQGVTFEQRPDGAVRHSQLLTTYGPGALVDLVKDAGVVAGLCWWAKGERVVEDRMLSLLATQAGLPGVTLHSPPTGEYGRAPEDRRWIRAITFPEWFVCQNETCWSAGRMPEWKGETPPRRLLHRAELDGSEHKCAGRGKGFPVKPVRFVRACPNGHLADLPWGQLVHGAGQSCAGPKLWMLEDGATAELASVRAICSGCKGSGFAMSLAAKRDGSVLGFCDETAPWLPGGRTPQAAQGSGCQQPWRLLLRSAADSWFPVTASVIHIPDRSAALREAVERVFTVVQKATSAEKLETLMELVDGVKRELGGFPRAEVLEEIRRRVEGRAIARKRVKQAELEALLAAPSEAAAFAAADEGRTTRPRWLAHQLDVPAALRSRRVCRVVLVPRLTEVRALIGFTRFESQGTDIDGELDLNAQRAPLDEPVTWLPAVENSGEGFFFSFETTELARWERENESVQGRAADFMRGFQALGGGGRRLPSPEFAQPRFVMLHSLSHLLIGAVATECGYSSSSIRERIYLGADECGVLLYTASPGAEGSLGGLVEAGRDLERHFERALDAGRLCSNDPVCAEHAPAVAGDRSERQVEGASCHGCLLISETSCERQNTFLDRALVVPTVKSADTAYFAAL